MDIHSIECGWFYEIGHEGENEPILKVLRHIQSGLWQSQISHIRSLSGPAREKAIKKLPAFLASAKTTNGGRKRKDLADHTGLLQVEIDAQADLSEAAALRDRLRPDSHVLAAWVSASGTGVQALVPIEDSFDYHKRSFGAVKAHFREQHSITLRPRCGDVTRLGSVSCDPDLFVNPDASQIPPQTARSQCQRRSCAPSPESNPSPRPRKGDLPGSQLRPLAIHECFSKDQIHQLCCHLHGDINDPRFGHAFTSKDGEPTYVANKRKTFEECVASTWDSVVGVPDRPYCVMVGSNVTHRERSSFYAFDIDVHAVDSHTPNASPAHHDVHVLRDIRGFIREALKLHSQGISYLVEDSGRGWHLWLISKMPMGIEEWRRVVRPMTESIDFSQPFEEYPCKITSAAGSTGKAKLIRVPGGANPATFHLGRGDWSVGLVHSHNLDDSFWSSLDPFTKEKSLSLFNAGLHTGEAADAERPCRHRLLVELLEKYRIRSPSTRHNQTLSMMGEGVYHFSEKTLLGAAEALYKEAAPSPGTPLEAHLIEAQGLFRYSFEKNVLPKLNEGEKNRMKEQSHSSSKAAFVIIRNFANLSPKSFPISGPDLSKRLGVTTQSAYEIIKRFVRDEIIRCVDASWVKGRRSKRYAWIVSQQPEVDR